LKTLFEIILGGALLASAAFSAPAQETGDHTTEASRIEVDPEIPVVLLVDQSAGQTLFSRDPDRRFVPASVTKIMTVYTAFDLIKRGKLSLDRKVVIDKKLADEWGGEGSTLFLQEGDELTVAQLLLGVTTVSANDGAVAIARTAAGSDAAWLALMNENARKLGMRDSHFGSPNGYPDEGRTWTSAHDLALLAEALTTRFPKLYKRFFGHKGMRFHDIAQRNHDPITGVVRGADGIKTGFTRQAGYNFVGSAARGGRRLTLVIAGSPTSRIRAQAARQLMEWGFANFRSEELLPAGAVIGSVEVQDGASLQVPVRTETEVFANLPRAGEQKARFMLRYSGPVVAPIVKGDRIATLQVSIPGQQPNDVPLVAARSVDRANALERLRNGIVGLF
jgi:D-alanyl-D-alanine carboxypeptidase (penicillin-binding protein 5/6)